MSIFPIPPRPPNPGRRCTWPSAHLDRRPAPQPDRPARRHRIPRAQGRPLEAATLADWSDRDLGQYLARHDLPFHPLWDPGYASIGDVHTTRPRQPGMREEDSRFFGLRRQCGLHFDQQRESA